MEFAVGVFVRLLNAAHGFDDVQRGNQIDVQLGGIADQADDGVLGARGDVQVEAMALEEFGQIVNLLGICVLFQKNNHVGLLHSAIRKAPQRVSLRSRIPEAGSIS